jgi:hypothetical protein
MSILYTLYSLVYTKDMHANIWIRVQNKLKWLALGQKKSDFVNYCLDRYADDYLHQQISDEPVRTEPEETA